MNLKKIGEIIKFDVKKDIQNKWFIILNIFIFIGIIIATNGSNFVNYLNEHNINIFKEDSITVQVVDSKDIFYNLFKEKYSSDDLKVEKVENNSYSKENIPENNIILVEVNYDDKNLVTAKIISKEGISTNIYNEICDELKETRNEIFAQNKNIPISEINILNDNINVERELLGVDAKNSSAKETIKTVSIYIIYAVLIIILAKIASSIAQEKMSKSIEYVLTSVTAKEYLLAKVLSVTFSTLIQILYIFVYYVIGISINSLFVMNTVGGNVNSVSSNVDQSLINYTIVMCAYLIFTVFLTALIQATLSSRTKSTSEAGNTTIILIALLVVIYLISLSAISPYKKVSIGMYIVSCLPFISTFFVPSMMIIGQATYLQIIISFVILIASIPLIFNICSKYFKEGILDYTLPKKKSKKELSLKEKQEKDLKNEEAKKFGFTIGMAFILLVFLETVLSYIFEAVLPNLFYTDSNTLKIILNGAVSFLSLGIVTIYILANSDYTYEKENLTGRKIFEYTFIGIAIMAIVQVVLSWLYEKINLNYNIIDEAELKPSGSLFSGFVYIMVMAIIPAVFEELLFRKAILNYAKKYGNAFAVIFSAFLFAMFHFNLNQGIFAFLIGILFGIIAIKSGSIKITVLLHFLNNSFAALQIVLNGFSLDVFNNMTIAIVIFGIIVLIKNLPKLRNVKKEDFKINKDCLLILKNYTFVVSMILVIVLFITTEKFLKL